ncbi:MAG: DeoR/GlpR family DNA-binding transcription regulator [Candidatus Dormibacteria bacterium]
MSGPHLPAARLRLIAEMIQQSGSVRLRELQELLGVSEPTIRRDLDLLEREGILERTHGGAMASTTLVREPNFHEKATRFAEAKALIGQAAAAMIEADDTVFVHSGTTCRELLRRLPLGLRVTVVTSNLAAADLNPAAPTRLVLAGGEVRAQSHSLVGPVALATLNRYVASRSFVGVDGVSLKFGLSTPDEREAEVARAMIERTHGPVVVLADRSKLGVVASVVTAGLYEITHLLVEGPIDADFARGLARVGVDVVFAQDVLAQAATAPARSEDASLVSEGQQQ